MMEQVFVVLALVSSLLNTTALRAYIYREYKANKRMLVSLISLWLVHVDAPFFKSSTWAFFV